MKLNHNDHGVNTQLNYLSEGETTLLFSYLTAHHLALDNVIIMPQEFTEFSNRYPASFKLGVKNDMDDKFEWRSTEQYMQFQKLSYIEEEELSADDKQTLAQLRQDILAAPSADEAVELTSTVCINGKSVNQLLQKIWFDSVRRDVLLAENKAKFPQNWQLREKLILTSGKKILAVSVETKNHTWSIAKENGSFGLNWAGEILMETRDHLAKKHQLVNLGFLIHTHKEESNSLISNHLLILLHKLS